MMKFTTIILAAGKGTRMKSDLPKVLHPVCGRPMIHFPIQVAEDAGASEIITVIGHGAESVKDELSDLKVSFVTQEKQLGTGHAVIVCRDAVSDRSLPIVILCGDVPLLRESTLEGLVRSHKAEKNSVTVLTACVDDPGGYGRIIKDGDEILRIVEEKDASAEEKSVREINSGIYCVDGDFLFEALDRVGNSNAQGEYYLTDIIKIGREMGRRVGWSTINDSLEIMGINSRRDLAIAEKAMGKRVMDGLMDSGVTIKDPDNTYMDIDVSIGAGSVVYPQVSLGPGCRVGKGCTIETGSVIKNSAVADRAHIKPYCVIDGADLGEDTTIGPFAHLRPGTVLKSAAKAGNFVEIKKATIGEGSKVNHLSYIGDADVGSGVNVGAGTITCNYDGKNKFQTVIEDGVFIGSGTNLVAPLRIGSGSTIGAGSTITKDVPPEALSLTRPEQKILPDWTKKKNKEAK